MKIRHTATAIVILLTLAAGCVTPPPAQNELTRLVGRDLVLLPDKSLDSVSAKIIQKDVIFLGEVHQIPELYEAAYQIILLVAAERPLVYAKEMVYGMHPFLEDGSMGRANPVYTYTLAQPLAQFNERQPPDRKILMTALDVEHTIEHDKASTVRFLQELVRRSSSQDVRDALESHIPRLTDTKSFDEVDAYLRELNNLFISNLKTFSAADQDEIRFSLDLLQASNTYRRHNATRWTDLRFFNQGVYLRYEYFKKTIVRAHEKAQQRNAALLCHVGNGHATYGSRWEAHYFARKYPPTRGKVFAIQMIPLYYEEDPNILSNPHKDVDPIAIAAHSLMADCAWAWLPLQQFHKNANVQPRWSGYFPSGKPECDALLFIKTRAKQKK
ncbi:MAG: hypothetical protein LLF76_13480 [Planctomycetaceae bacterium]|nr:hypothetical protein [Planctomycetaceae bacterium]